jgi:hypothetical protein
MLERLKKVMRPPRERELVKLTDEDRRYLTTLHDDSVPLPPGAEQELLAESPRLRALRDEYASQDLPVLDSSRWSRERVEAFLDLRYFRGETLIVWHYRELPRITKLKYFIFARYVADRDPQRLPRQPRRGRSIRLLDLQLPRARACQP